MIERFEPGVAVHFARNPHAWQRDADGARLPRVARLHLRLVASQDAEMLQLASGELDIPTGELRPEDVAEARRLEKEGALQTFDLGAALAADVLWFNLQPGAQATRRSPRGCASGPCARQWRTPWTAKSSSTRCSRAAPSR